MKYFYKIIKVENNKEKTILAINKKYNIIKEKYDNFLKKNKNIKMYKTHKNGKYVSHKLILLTNNPHSKGLEINTNNGYKILEINNIYEEKLFYTYPDKKYVSFNEIDELKGYIFYIFLNKIIFEREDKKDYLIVCSNRKEASYFAHQIKLSKNNIFFGVLNKKMRSLYNEKILENFDIKYETLYKPYI